MAGIFDSYKSEKTTFTQLPEGKQRMKLVAIVMLNSFLNHDGSVKSEDKKKPWADSTPQMAITVVGVDNKGGMTHRLNGLGYKRFSELTKEQQESGKFQNCEGYACVKDKAGRLVRIEDKAKTEQCSNILNELFYAVGLPEGSTIDNLQDKCAQAPEFIAEVVKDSYKEKDNFKLIKFRRANSAVLQTAGTVSSDFEE